MPDAVHMIAARRTPIVPTGGFLKNLQSYELAAEVAQACLADAGIPSQDVDEMVISCCLGEGGNPARLAALKADCPESVSGLTIDRQCCGGLDALLVGAAMIKSGAAKIVLAGGCESFSMRPACYRRVHFGAYAKKPIDQASFTPWPDRDPNMHKAAEKLSQRYGILKQAQDEWAIQSHQKALKGQSALRKELTPIGNTEVVNDPFSRNLSPSICQRARQIYGSITTANMSVAADGAAICLLVTEGIARSLPSVEMMGGFTIGGDPEWPALAGVTAIRKTLQYTGLKSADDLSVAEIMEAYAVQAIAMAKLADIDPEIINRQGGSLARGHPIGASGAVLAVRVFHQLIDQSARLGLAAVAAAGGLGTAILFRSSKLA